MMVVELINAMARAVLLTRSFKWLHHTIVNFQFRTERLRPERKVLRYSISTKFINDIYNSSTETSMFFFTILAMEKKFHNILFTSLEDVRKDLFSTEVNLLDLISKRNINKNDRVTAPEPN